MGRTSAQNICAEWVISAQSGRSGVHAAALY